ncbi:hypothetical protein ACFS7Z_16250 [Pontibacter toksunensis]|uniref:SMP-30/gluconolaconase/LRE-like protein n=1 Tax=Pontibacter toksunensis TaxID=1332631 RepID=A0ABW6BXN2_9BACT
MKQLSVTTAAFLKKRFSFVLFFLICLGTVSCSPEELWDDFKDVMDDVDAAKRVPEKIMFTNPGLYPEGVSHDALNRRFLVSSITTGNIGTVSYDGNYMPFITDDRLVSAVGLEVDEARNRVLVAGADPGGTPNSSPATTAQTAVLGIYDLETGAPMHFVDLGALRPGMGHFANDFSVDKQGNAYITDSFSPIIYKVDMWGNASVFFENEDFATSPGAFGFNGIAFHPSGYLLVAYSVDNAIYKIPLKNTSAISKVQLNDPLERPDGLLLSQNGKQLIVVNNAGGAPSGRVLSFKSNDMWNSGTLNNSFIAGEVFPTAPTGYGDEVFVLYAYLNQLFNGQELQEVYTIRKMPFSDNETFGR